MNKAHNLLDQKSQVSLNSNKYSWGFLLISMLQLLFQAAQANVLQSMKLQQDSLFANLPQVG